MHSLLHGEPARATTSHVRAPRSSGALGALLTHTKTQLDSPPPALGKEPMPSAPTLRAIAIVSLIVALIPRRRGHRGGPRPA